MKRAVFLYSLILIYLASGCPASGQTDAGPDAEKACPFTIVGLWRSDATTQSNPVFFSFSPEGWVRLLGHSPDIPAEAFEVIAEVRYKVNRPAAPRGIEFITTRGNDVFQPGVTTLDITRYGDDSFTTQDPVSQQKTQWVRERTHRYFLTFAARNVPGGPAFAMWTVMDGQRNRIQALGIQPATDGAGKAAPTFGPIPAEVYERIVEEKEKKTDKDKEENVIARFELTEAEFGATYKVYQEWDKHVKAQALPHGDAYTNTIDFLSRAAEGLNQCGEKIKLQRPTRSERDEIASKNNPPQHALEYVRLLRKKNGELHVTDKAFPWGWRPMIQAPAQ